MNFKNFKIKLQFFAEAGEEGSEAPEDTMTAKEYIEAVKKLKETMVPKEEYDKLKEENGILIDAVMTGQTVESNETQKEDKKDLNQMRKELFEEDNSNLEYATKALALREELIKQGYPDPFLPSGIKIQPDENDIKKANNLAECLKHCIEYAEGDSEVFTNELSRITNDVGPKRINTRLRR